jgi:hypothetical protein
VFDADVVETLSFVPRSDSTRSDHQCLRVVSVPASRLAGREGLDAVGEILTCMRMNGAVSMAVEAALFAGLLISTTILLTLSHEPIASWYPSMPSSHASLTHGNPGDREKSLHGHCQIRFL